MTKRKPKTSKPDNDPIRLPVSAFRRGGGVLKIKRGGPGKRSSSGTLQTRYHAPIRAVRDFRKPSKRHNGEFRVQPKVPDSPPIWNPLDPFIIALRHPGVTKHVRIWQCEPTGAK